MAEFHCRKHIRDVVLHVDIETRDTLRRISPERLTNDDQRVSFLIYAFREFVQSREAKR